MLIISWFLTNHVIIKKNHLAEQETITLFWRERKLSKPVWMRSKRKWQWLVQLFGEIKRIFYAKFIFRLNFKVSFCNRFWFVFFLRFAIHTVYGHEIDTNPSIKVVSHHTLKCILLSMLFYDKLFMTFAIVPFKIEVVVSCIFFAVIITFHPKNSIDENLVIFHRNSCISRDCICFVVQQVLNLRGRIK